MKRDTNLTRIVVLAVVIVAVLTLAVITISKFSRFRAQNSPVAESGKPNDEATEQTRQAIEDGAIVYKGVRYVRRSGIESYLILGVDLTDAERYNGVVSGQADVQLLLVIDPRESRFRILQLNRDTVAACLAGLFPRWR